MRLLLAVKEEGKVENREFFCDSVEQTCIHQRHVDAAMLQRRDHLDETYQYPIAEHFDRKLDFALAYHQSAEVAVHITLSGALQAQLRKAQAYTRHLPV